MLINIQTFSVFQVPSNRQMIVNVQNVSFTCPGLQLNIRDGVEARDTLLYTIHEDTNVSVSVRTSGHVSRLELVSDTWNMNSSLCYAVMHVGVIIKGTFIANFFDWSGCCQVPRIQPLSHFLISQFSQCWQTSCSHSAKMLFFLQKCNLHETLRWEPCGFS